MGPQLPSKADVTVRREDRTRSFGAGEVFGAHRAHRHLQIRSVVKAVSVSAVQLKQQSLCKSEHSFITQ